MAKLSDEILTNIFSLQRQLAEGIGEVSAVEWALFEQYGETDESIGELEELKNAKERLTIPYSRLHTLLLRILEAQPTASAAMLNLLAQTLEQGQAALDASNASVREIKRNWDLL
ncbi:MAG: hypothetical protein MUD14_10935 [Hydrococcus sp. Prado102]|jgi:hypothetical protein|nr:hypothetical protein [Hydrococcus sp. Prado102]